MATQAQVPHRTLGMALTARLRRPTLGMVVTTIVLLALVVVMVIPYTVHGHERLQGELGDLQLPTHALAASVDVGQPGRAGPDPGPQ